MKEKKKKVKTFIADSSIRWEKGRRREKEGILEKKERNMKGDGQKPYLGRMLEWSPYSPKRGLNSWVGRLRLPPTYTIIISV